MDPAPGDAAEFRGRPTPLRGRLRAWLGGSAFLLVAAVLYPTPLGPPAALRRLTGIWGEWPRAEELPEVLPAIAAAVVSLGVWAVLVYGGVTVLAVVGWIEWHTRRLRVLVDAQGCEVRHGGRRIPVPWSDMESWSITEASGGTGPEYGPAVVAVPAGSVKDPGRGTRAALWSKDRGTWVMFRPALLDAPREEVEAALMYHAGHLRRHDADGLEG
jgi:hypothetical protein